ncbi:acyl carrier protein [Tahibacter amnicola]|uniref:Phosphopantetheine-binding protein n=1 Tax=Tahibacter amnicola TaxID=2976241 RepID=A0ABY6BKI6_9GAMM|nr:phosphopantetheine-binding protein [Tahibacter amnicola]UXI69101.1 phosphopantetheine-binding protein [Tahibacter amnicola]
MKNPYDENKMVALVQATLQNVLGLGADEITPDSAIGDDLGAESLDFVEMRYSLERQLGIVLPQRSVLDHYAAAAGDPQAPYDNGRLSQAGAVALQKSFFAYSSEQASAGMYPAQVMGNATVRNWALLCLRILDHLPEKCPDCQHTTAVAAPSGKPVCAGCNAPLKPLSGDEAIAASMAALVAPRQREEVAAA